MGFNSGFKGLICYCGERPTDRYGNFRQCLDYEHYDEMRSKVSAKNILLCNMASAKKKTAKCLFRLQALILFLSPSCLKTSGFH